MERTLHGSCACGRNHYIVEVPPSSDQLASILFDSSLRTRRHQATPFSAFLRVPLSWYHSSASAFFPDEPPHLIRRTFHDEQPRAPTGLRRQFCGFCGTPLTAWHERTREDADFIALTLGSLREQDVGELEDMGLFRGGDEGEDGGEAEGSRAATPTAAGARQLRREVFGPLQVAEGRGAPWFERLVEDSRLGAITRTRGGYEASDGSWREEWEVLEWTNEGEEAERGTPGKRKLGAS